MSREATLDVFFSYSHRDAGLREQLEKHLALLRRRRVICTWYDGEITAGEEWSPELFGRLETADVVLLLISPDFIASDFCWRDEMTRALARHEAGEARVIPIVLRPVDDWVSAPFGKLQVRMLKLVRFGERRAKRIAGSARRKAARPRKSPSRRRPPGGA